MTPLPLLARGPERTITVEQSERAFERRKATWDEIRRLGERAEAALARANAKETPHE